MDFMLLVVKRKIPEYRSFLFGNKLILIRIFFSTVITISALGFYLYFFRRFSPYILNISYFCSDYYHYYLIY